jgi:pimeloyl-ACP methyl ester carboxylesterase
MRTLLLACSVPLLTGCCTTGYRTDLGHTTQPSVSVPNPVGVVFVANGSGDFRTVSTNLGRVVVDTSTPLQIETVLWSHGYGRYVTDHVDHTNHLHQGSRLAAEVAAYRQAYPGRKVYLIGHSAGCAVVLAAAERLPTDSVDRIILLAPSVCVSYDLRPALRTARCGIDEFHSDEDRVILGLGMQMVGTADRCCRTAAGQYGFIPVIAGPADAVLYGKLRQHPWGPVVSWSGHGGGHYGSNQAGFLRAYVLPLLVAD